MSEESPQDVAFDDLEPEYIYIPSASAHLMVNEVAKSLLQQRTETLIQIDPIDGRKDIYLVKISAVTSTADKAKALRSVIDIGQRGFQRCAFVLFPFDKVSKNVSLAPWKGLVADGLKFRRCSKPMVLSIQGPYPPDATEEIGSLESIQHSTKAMSKKVTVLPDWSRDLYETIQDRLFQVGVLTEHGLSFKIKLTLGKQLYEVLGQGKKVESLENYVESYKNGTMLSHFSAVLPYEKIPDLKRELTQLGCKPLPLRPEKRLTLVFQLGDMSSKLLQVYCRVDENGVLSPVKIREWPMRHFVITEQTGSTGELDYRVKIESKISAKSLEEPDSLSEISLSISETIQCIRGFKLDEETGRLQLNKSNPTPALLYAHLKVKSVFKKDDITIRVNKIFSTSGRGFSELTAGANLGDMQEEINQGTGRFQKLLSDFKSLGESLSRRLYELDPHFHDNVPPLVEKRPRWIEMGKNSAAKGKGEHMKSDQPKSVTRMGPAPPQALARRDPSNSFGPRRGGAPRGRGANLGRPGRGRPAPY